MNCMTTEEELGRWERLKREVKAIAAKTVC
jgi:hypothetical protein